MQISFISPEYLFLLFLLPILVFVHFFAIRMTKKTAIKFSNFDSIARIKGVDIFSKNLIVLILSSLIILLLILAISGLSIVLNVNSSKFAYIVALDTSESMLANDLLPNRLDFAKQNIISFIENLPYGTKVGIISFSGNAIIESKITQDKNIILKSIEGIKVTEIGGTDISEALVTSTNLLIDEPYRAIILLSDGQINTGKIDKAIEYANKNNVVIHTVGVGTISGGETSYGISKLDEDSLKSISYNTKGIYSNLQDGGTLSEVFNKITKFEKVDVKVNLSKYLIVISLVLFLLHFVLINTRYRTYP